MRVRPLAPAVLASAMCLSLAACGGGNSDSAVSSAIAPVKTNAKNVTCSAEKVGPVTRCTNFYDDYWPTIKANMDKLYKQALKVDGGRLVVWDWYKLSDDVIKQFHKAFPKLKIETRGLTYNLSSAIVSAKATGQRNTDIVSGSITSMTAMYDQKFVQKIDWTKYGVPKQYLDIGAPELLPDSLNGTLLQYNTKSIKSVPTNLNGLTDPKYKGKVAIADYNAAMFSGYGMKYGKSKMTSLIKKLTKSGNLALVDDPTSLVSNGEKPIAISGPLYNPNPDLKVATFDGTNVYLQFTGVNSDAKNKPAAVLWTLWNAYDPAWLKARATQATFATSAVPYPGLPKSVFTEEKGLVAENAKALLGALKDGQAETETQATRDKWNSMIDTADKALKAK